MRLTNRLALVIVAAVTPIVAVEIYNAYALIEETRRETRTTAQQYARLASWEMQRLIDGLKGVMTTIAAAPQIRAGDWRECEAFVETLTPAVPGLYGLALTDGKGIVRCGPGAVEGIDLSHSTYFTAAMTGAPFVTGSFTRGPLHNHPVLPFAVPIRSREGAPIGTVVAGLDLDWLSRSLEQRGLPPQGSLTIADRDGVILARQPLPEKFIGTAIPEPYLHLLHEPAPGALEVVSQDGTRRTLGYQPLSLPLDGIYVSAGLAVENSYAGAFSATLRALGVALAAVAIAILTAWHVGRRFVAAPVAALVRVAERWRGGDLSARSDLKGDDEFARLGAVFDQAIEQAKAREERIGLLVREVTHRVKNQMSVMASMARRSGRNAANVADFQKAFSARIMALSRSHDLVFADAGEAGLRNLIDAQLAPFTSSGRLEVTGPDTLIDPQASQYLGMALHELATNAVKYGALSKEGGRIAISWQIEPIDGVPTLRLTWRETGGPRIERVEAEGFGTVVLDKIVGSALGGVSAYALEPDGAVWTCTFSDHFSVAGAEPARETA